MPGDLVWDIPEAGDQVSQEGFVKGRRLLHSNCSAEARFDLAGDRCSSREIHPAHAAAFLACQRDHRTVVHKMRNPALTLPENVPLTFETPIRRRCPTGISM